MTPYISLYEGIEFTKSCWKKRHQTVEDNLLNENFRIETFARWS